MKYLSQKPALVDINSLTGADYNPRKMVPERLKQVEISLRKLGFLLPIYISPQNVILSGHQRTRAAKMAGYTKVPVVVIDVNPEVEKGLNLVFNKGTNDLDTFSGTAKASFEEYLSKADNLTNELPDIPPDTYYPCMEAKQVLTADWQTQIVGLGDSLRTAGRELATAGVYMPLVVCDGKVLNGLGRLAGYFSLGATHIDVVEIPSEKADYAYLALNFLAMDFDIQANFANELRYNAFRRKGVQAQIVGLSRTFTFFVYNRVVSNTRGKLLKDGNPDLDLLPGASKEAFDKFKATYGDTMFDMGAGTLHDSNLLREAGLDCTPFEPYYCPPGQSEPNPDESRAVNSAMLDKLATLKKTGPSSIVSSFVLNSIPHHKDRMAYLCILAAMSKMKTTVFLGTQPVNVLEGNSINHHLRLNGVEKNMTLGNSSKFFKAQKFFYPEELEKMAKVFFSKVEMVAVDPNIFIKCSMPKRPNPALLRESLDLEFNLPYADGSTMGLNEKAKAIFSDYLGMTL